jgi:hypothetical protein
VLRAGELRWKLSCGVSLFLESGRPGVIIGLYVERPPRVRNVRARLEGTAWLQSALARLNRAGYQVDWHPADPGKATPNIVKHLTIGQVSTLGAELDRLAAFLGARTPTAAARDRAPSSGARAFWQVRDIVSRRAPVWRLSSLQLWRTRTLRLGGTTWDLWASVGPTVDSWIDTIGTALFFTITPRQPVPATSVSEPRFTGIRRSLESRGYELMVGRRGTTLQSLHFSRWMTSSAVSAVRREAALLERLLSL